MLRHARRNLALVPRKPLKRISSFGELFLEKKKGRGGGKKKKKNHEKQVPKA